MELGKGPNAVRAEELILVQHSLKDLGKPLLVHEGKQDSVVLATGADAVHRPLGNVATMLHEPLDALLERWEFVDQFGFEREGGVKGDESNQRSDGHLLDPGSTPRNGIIVEAVLLVPERLLILLPRPKRHGVADKDEVLKELGRNILVDAPVLGELQGNVEHVEAVKCHPARAVRLLQRTAGRERL